MIPNLKIIFLKGGTSHLNCFSSNPGNLRLIDGTLAMTTIRQKYLNKFYTTPQLTSKKSFTYGRFELRAALPRAKMIKTTIRLKPKKDGRIDIAANHQTEQLLYGLQKGRSFSGTATVEENLNEFNIYGLEWTPSQITWIFNGRTLETFNTTEGIVDNYNPFSNPVKIHMFMAIGGNYSNKNEYFPGQTLYEKDADEWNCSLLIFDYIRVYQNVPDYNRTQIEQIKVNSSIENDLPTKINVTSSDICRKVMSEIQPKKSSWKLIFSDEFTNETLDQNKWNIQHRSSDCESKLGWINLIMIKLNN